jgi:hypothetical protein
MVRKQIYIEPTQDELLKRHAKLLGVSEAELVRRGIDLVTDRDPDLAERLRIWEEEKDWIRKNRMMDVPQTGRQWTREELYEERLGRCPR